MRNGVKALIMSAALAATTVVPLTSARADDWHHGWHHHHGHGDAVAAGVLGLAAGAIIGGAIASDPGPRVYEDVPADDYYYRPAPRVYRPVREVYVDRSIEPWSRAWYDYCSSAYRSFNPRTGTYVGFDGDEHFCVAN